MILFRSRKRARLQQEQRERIESLERWHRIFDEWADDTGDNWSEAVEMAKQGLTRMAFILKQYYLPPFIEQLNKETFLLGLASS